MCASSRNFSQDFQASLEGCNRPIRARSRARLSRVSLPRLHGSQRARSHRLISDVLCCFGLRDARARAQLEKLRPICHGRTVLRTCAYCSVRRMPAQIAIFSCGHRGVWTKKCPHIAMRRWAVPVRSLRDWRYGVGTVTLLACDARHDLCEVFRSARAMPPKATIMRQERTELVRAHGL